jgi:hypothetical protein
MRVRFSPRLARQTGATEGDVRLTQALEAHQVMLILYTLYPGLLGGVAGRANREVIARHLRLWRNGEPVPLGEPLTDRDSLILSDPDETEGG